jgi:hypothetical protein
LFVYEAKASGANFFRLGLVVSLLSNIARRFFLRFQSNLSQQKVLEMSKQADSGLSGWGIAIEFVGRAALTSKFDLVLKQKFKHKVAILPLALFNFIYLCDIIFRPRQRQPSCK